MVDEFGAFGMDWAAFSRELVDRNALARTRRRGTPRGAVARIRCTVRAIMTRNRSGPRARGAASGGVTESARSILPDR